ncbi:MAG: TGS domain-containing protein, partial [Anaerolineae bacterium]|nr:TGS domain-containing protein [Anaerolineae bacterium]
MGTVKATVSDGSVVEVEAGAAISEVAARVACLDGPAIAAIVDGKEVDLSYPLTSDSRVEFITLSSAKGK